MRGLFGERARTAVYGWSDLAFDAWHIKRNVLGHTVHIVLKPEWIERVLLDNAANYEKPRLVKRILDPTIGRGLLSSDGELWRAQRKIVAASFTPPAVDALVPVFGEVGMSMAQSWEAGVRDMAVEATTRDDGGHRAGFVQRRPAAHQPRSDGPYHRGDGGRRRGADPGAARPSPDPDRTEAGGAGNAASGSSGRRWTQSCASGSAATRPMTSSRE